jgi:hypothetical protein
MSFITAHGGSHAPYRRALLTAFDEHPGIPPEDRVAAMFELSILRLMDIDRDQYREYLAKSLYRMADALAVAKGPIK